MMIPPYFPEVALVTTKPYPIFQPKVPDHILYVSFLRTAAEKVQSPIACFPLRSGECLKDGILTLTEYFIAANCRKSHLL